jgi:hypothetical protein
VGGALGVDAPVGGEHARGDGGLAEELGRVLLGGHAQPDGLAGVGDLEQVPIVARPGGR